MKKSTANQRKEHNVVKYISVDYNAVADNGGGVSIFIRLAVVAYRFNEIWSMTDTRQCAMTRSKVKVAEVRNSRKWPF